MVTKATAFLLLGCLELPSEDCVGTVSGFLDNLIAFKDCKEVLSYNSLVYLLCFHRSPSLAVSLTRGSFKLVPFFLSGRSSRACRYSG